MKNLYLLPTNKSSKLYLHSNKGLELRSDIVRSFNGYLGSNQHIYITSDEEIKEGDYAYHKTFGVGKIININGEDCFVTIKLNPKDGSITTPWKRNIPDIKKIILTTDQDLIKDGIQAIGDDFLEWFVKNPSCGWVEITTFFSGIDYPYEIIIPKKESKPIHEQIIDVVGGEDRFREIAGLKPKKETLVEDTLSKIKLVLSMSNEAQAIRLLEQYGELQAERMYSEEEVLEIVSNCDGSISQAKKWFEQFKKK